MESILRIWLRYSIALGKSSRVLSMALMEFMAWIELGFARMACSYANKASSTLPRSSDKLPRAAVSVLGKAEMLRRAPCWASPAGLGHGLAPIWQGRQASPAGGHVYLTYLSGPRQPHSWQGSVARVPIVPGLEAEVEVERRPHDA